MDYYTEHAYKLYQQYQSADPERIHAPWQQHLPTSPGLACDIGAGSGRDAYWLASQGWEVMAVEPNKALRELAQSNKVPSNTGAVTWIDDKLPELQHMRLAGHRFNLILISAVWMHLNPTQAARAMRIISELLAPGGVLLISLRHNQTEDAAKERELRGFCEVNTNEVEALAKQRALVALPPTLNVPDTSRPELSWDYLTFKLLDDGTGQLPLLRHIIINDDKSSTYKLGLLRTLIRIADGAPGMVLKRSDDWVDIPFGLVALYWIKLYMPLVLQHNLIQTPSHYPREQKGLGFAKAGHFYELHKFSPYDLRVGATFNAEQAKVIVGAIRDVCANIQQMPAHHITYPGQSSTVFECDKQSVRAPKGHWQINKQSLRGFGTFRIPATLWQSLGQLACWLEPTIQNEWVRLMQGYDLQYDRSVYDKALAWDEGVHDTSLVKKRISTLQKDADFKLHCVWSNSQLKQHYHVDHCFPYSRWFNNDLWNLMPASVTANSAKSAKLPSAGLMHESQTRIQRWWQTAYMGSNNPLQTQFLMEAEAALPLLAEGEKNLSNVFDAVLHQRARLRANQGLVEWNM